MKLEPPQLLTPPPDTGTIIVSFPMGGKGQRWRATLGRPWGYGGSDTRELPEESSTQLATTL